jgi:hypothetical protein
MRERIVRHGRLRQREHRGKRDRNRDGTLHSVESHTKLPGRNV